MSRAVGDSLAGGRNMPVGSSLLLLRRQQQQMVRPRGLGGGGFAGEEGGDESLDLFARDRRSVAVAACRESEGQNVPPYLGRISVGPAKVVRGGMDDLLSAADMGKHDYDWLLTPPGSPLAVDTRESHLSSVAPAPNNNPSSRSVSTNRTSRFSAGQLENNHLTKPARSSSATRPSICNTYSSSNISSNSNRTSILNTSTISVASSRPSTPNNRSATISATRQSTSTMPRPTSRPSTPSRIRPTSSSSSHGSRPSTPTSRSQNSAALNSNSISMVARSSSRPSTPTRRAPVQTSIPVVASKSISNSTVARSTSRQSTPTRRAPAQTSAPVVTHSHSAGRNLGTSGRNSAPASRASSPGPRVRAPLQPPVLPDLPLDVPPNLRTKVPERPTSAGRSRPGLPLTVRANSNPETVPTISSNARRPSSPTVTRGRLPDSSPKLRPQSNGHEVSPPEIQKLIQQENVKRKPIKTTTMMESTGFGRTISKTSLDMALRHMDIRQGMGAIRGAALFPQSIRSTAPKTRPARMSDPVIPVSGNGTDTEDNSCNGMLSTSCSSAASENGDIEVKSLERTFFAGRTSNPDIYESSRYDVMLLKEDSKSLNWLHSIEDKSDQSSVFDHSFEPLPEPFVL
ncbi:hypothetical protein Taro_053892 [Colocasia esculenta]|uniref:Uncharacterized protein n=1 Tax=Colocasia esculenta TaxID=4460 RepID=A0A843XNW2_COLES|nr:hypothetical protein [Colocasia esculenta]